MKININCFTKKLLKINNNYLKNSCYFDADVEKRINSPGSFNIYISNFNADTQDRIIDNTNNYFYLSDIKAKKYIYIPIVKLLYYFTLKAIQSNSATITIYNSELLKVFNIQERTLREYYNRLAIILPSLHYRYFDNITKKDALFINADFRNKSKYIVLYFNFDILKRIKAAQTVKDFNLDIFNNSKFNSKYDGIAFYIYLAFMFNEHIDFNLLLNSCYPYLEQFKIATENNNHINQQIFEPISKAINKLLFYGLLKIKADSAKNDVFNFVFQNGYIISKKLLFVEKIAKQEYKSAECRANTRKIRKSKLIKELETKDLKDYKELFNLLYV